MAADLKKKKNIGPLDHVPRQPIAAENDRLLANEKTILPFSALLFSIIVFLTHNTPTLSDREGKSKQTKKHTQHSLSNFLSLEIPIHGFRLFSRQTPLRLRLHTFCLPTVSVLFSFHISICFLLSCIFLFNFFISQNLWILW